MAAEVFTGNRWKYPTIRNCILPEFWAGQHRAVPPVRPCALQAF
jgi:hypothetical protein